MTATTTTTTLIDNRPNCWGQPGTGLNDAALVAANALAGFRQGQWRITHLEDLQRYGVTTDDIRQWLARHPEARAFRALTIRITPPRGQRTDRARAFSRAIAALGGRYNQTFHYWNVPRCYSRAARRLRARFPDIQRQRIDGTALRFDA